MKSVVETEAPKEEQGTEQENEENKKQKKKEMIN